MLISLDFIVVQFNFFFNDTATTEIYTLSLHDALPISRRVDRARRHQLVDLRGGDSRVRGRRLRARRRRRRGAPRPHVVRRHGPSLRSLRPFAAAGRWEVVGGRERRPAPASSQHHLNAWGPTPHALTRSR